MFDGGVNESYLKLFIISYEKLGKLSVLLNRRTFSILRALSNLFIHQLLKTACLIFLCIKWNVAPLSCFCGFNFISPIAL